MQAVGGVAAVTAGTAVAQQQSAQVQSAPLGKEVPKQTDDKVRKILAVAVGPKRTVSIDKNTTDAEIATVRPYIKGLIDWLKDNSKNTDLDEASKNFVLGDSGNPGYTIDYRENDLTMLDVEKPDVFQNVAGVFDCIVCMSTYVGEKAAASTTDIPIIVVTSDPSNPKFNQNVCGVCAIRPQLVSVGLRKFKKFENVKRIYALYRQNHKPSLLAKKGLGNAIDAGDWVGIRDRDDDKSITATITGLVKTNAGLLVLPADRFFGLGNAIVTAAGDMPTYWPTTDWPKNNPKGGGYGYPQETCGHYMAERIARMWSTPSGVEIPKEPFITVDPKSIKEVKPT